MDPYAIHMTPGTSIAAHISRLHASIIVHLQDPYLDFHHVSTYTRKRLWSLPRCPHGSSLGIDTMILWSLEPQDGMGLDFRLRIHGLLLLQRL